MPRLHLFELEDQAWFPSTWRSYMTDYLRHVQAQFGLHRLAAEPLAKAMEESESERIVDLCSGSGGPLVPLLEEWADGGRRTQATLTDLYPSAMASEQALCESGDLVSFRAEPVDATAVPEELDGMRTIFNGLHHFRPEQAKAVLADAVRGRRPIAVFEVADRTIPAILPLVLVPLFVLVMTPMIRPFRWSRLLWTYLIPVLPPAILWDGLVSYLRAYTPDELLAMGRAVEPEGYVWRSGYSKLEKSPARMTYLVGIPR